VNRLAAAARAVTGRLTPRRVIATGVVLVLALGAAITLWPKDSQVKVTAHLASAVGLYAGSDVRILGVKVGKVDSVTPQGTTVKVVLQYDGKYRVPAEAKAAVVAPSLVSERYLQLLPAYTGGAFMHTGADIPLSRTAVPVELDQITGNLDQLSVALGPNGANKNGALSDLLNTASKNLDGNGQAIHDTVANLSQATSTLAGGSDDLFATVTNLQSFTSTLAANDPQVRQLNTDLASVADQLSGERGDLGAALQNLAVALGQVSTFVHDNRSVLTTDVSQLADVTSAVAKQKDAIAQTLRNAPVALSDLGHAYDPASGTLDNRVDLPGAEGVSQLLCGLVGHGTTKATSAQLCDLFNSLNDRLTTLGDPSTGDLPLGLLSAPLTGSGS
jgi:phospholipid/cholesterol/gamma-HCH transport system substrate-binding protein